MDKLSDGKTLIHVGFIDDEIDMLPSDRVVFICLTMHARNKKTVVYPGHNVITEQCGVSKNRAITSLKKLKEKGLIKIHSLTFEDKERILKSKNCSGMGIGEIICEWCNCKTLSAQEHHHPVPKHIGGESVVNICANCHQEYHAMDKVIEFLKYVPEEAVLNE